MGLAGSSSRTFYIDVNSISGDEVVSLLTHALDPIAAQIEPPHVGETVIVYDEEENRCLARVNRIAANWVGLTLLWESWQPAVRFHW